MAEYSPEDYVLANKLNVKLALEPDSQTASEARGLATKMLDYVREQTEDYDAFVQRVERAEKFPLTDSAQPKKDEKALKVVYLRAKTLLDAAASHGG
ncbi:MAG: hypothetical protein VYC39_10225 [Myxococcota bacterium]|nr:hypothetical protein [Myxococcota bacterium]